MRLRDAMLLAEDLLLLLTDDRTGRLLASSTEVDVALGGALLVELALGDRVDLAGASEARGRLFVRDTSPTGDELLDDALAKIAAKESKRPEDVVRRLGKGLRDRLYARLADRGVLREESGRILRVLPVHHWPATDAGHEDEVRGRLAEALRTGVVDDPRIAALISLLHALKAVGTVIDPASAGVSKHELNANAKRIAEGDWGAEAVRQAIEALLAAVVASSSVAVSGGT